MDRQSTLRLLLHLYGEHERRSLHAASPTVADPGHVYIKAVPSYTPPPATVEYFDTKRLERTPEDELRRLGLSALLPDLPLDELGRVTDIITLAYINVMNDAERIDALTKAGYELVRDIRNETRGGQPMRISRVVDRVMDTIARADDRIVAKPSATVDWYDILARCVLFMRSMAAEAPVFAMMCVVEVIAASGWWDRTHSTALYAVATLLDNYLLKFQGKSKMRVLAVPLLWCGIYGPAVYDAGIIEPLKAGGLALLHMTKEFAAHTVREIFGMGDGPMAMEERVLRNDIGATHEFNDANVTIRQHIQLLTYKGNQLCDANARGTPYALRIFNDTPIDALSVHYDPVLQITDASSAATQTPGELQRGSNTEVARMIRGNQAEITTKLTETGCFRTENMLLVATDQAATVIAVDANGKCYWPNGDVADKPYEVTMDTDDAVEIMRDIDKDAVANALIKLRENTVPAKLRPSVRIANAVHNFIGWAYETVTDFADVSVDDSAVSMHNPGGHMTHAPGEAVFYSRFGLRIACDVATFDAHTLLASDPCIAEAFDVHDGDTETYFVNCTTGVLFLGIYTRGHRYGTGYPVASMRRHFGALFPGATDLHTRVTDHLVQYIDGAYFVDVSRDSRTDRYMFMRVPALRCFVSRDNAMTAIDLINAFTGQLPAATELFYVARDGTMYRPLDRVAADTSVIDLSPEIIKTSARTAVRFGPRIPTGAQRRVQREATGIDPVDDEPLMVFPPVDVQALSHIGLNDVVSQLEAMYSSTPGQSAAFTTNTVKPAINDVYPDLAAYWILNDPVSDIGERFFMGKSPTTGMLYEAVGTSMAMNVNFWRYFARLAANESDEQLLAHATRLTEQRCAKLEQNNVYIEPLLAAALTWGLTMQLLSGLEFEGEWTLGDRALLGLELMVRGPDWLSDASTTANQSATLSGGPNTHAINVARAVTFLNVARIVYTPYNEINKPDLLPAPSNPASLLSRVGTRVKSLVRNVLNPANPSTLPLVTLAAAAVAFFAGPAWVSGTYTAAAFLLGAQGVAGAMSAADAAKQRRRDNAIAELRALRELETDPDQPMVRRQIGAHLRCALRFRIYGHTGAPAAGQPMLRARPDTVRGKLDGLVVFCAVLDRLRTKYAAVEQGFFVLLAEFMRRGDFAAWFAWSRTQLPTFRPQRDQYIVDYRLPYQRAIGYLEDVMSYTGKNRVAVSGFSFYWLYRDLAPGYDEDRDFRVSLETAGLTETHVRDIVLMPQ